MAEEEAPVVKTSRSLSTGDGIAIFAFLLFICAWVALCILTSDFDDFDSSDPSQEMDAWSAMFFLLIMLAPPFWAFGSVVKILSRD
jgi:hypothetical protein